MTIWTPADGAEDAIKHLRAFRTRTGLSADRIRAMTRPPDTGELPERYAEPLKEAQRQRSEAYMLNGNRRGNFDAPAYLVSSFGTPIGWITLDGGRVIPEVTYHSQAMSRHQELVRRAFADLSQVHLYELLDL